MVNKLRGALRWKAVGHAGTLDPPATGLLIVLCGDCTSRSREFMTLPKTYLATFRFGLQTTTDDLDGEIVARQDVAEWDARGISSALRDFEGEIQQVPPAVSAVKVGGRRSYALARAGIAADLKPRSVTVYSIHVLTMRPPEIDLEITCSQGTYIRSLARDLGRRLGWGGTLAELRRAAIGPYHVETALSVETIVRRRIELGCE